MRPGSLLHLGLCGTRGTQVGVLQLRRCWGRHSFPTAAAEGADGGTRLQLGREELIWLAPLTQKNRWRVALSVSWDFNLCVTKGGEMYFVQNLNLYGKLPV